MELSSRSTPEGACSQQPLAGVRALRGGLPAVAQLPYRRFHPFAGGGAGAAVKLETVLQQMKIWLHMGKYEKVTGKYEELTDQGLYLDRR